MIDDDCAATPDWVKNIIISHKKYPTATAIQGYSISIPKGNIYSLIMQRQREFRIKASVIPGEILYLNTNNTSFKKEKLQRFNIRFDESMKHSGIIDFAAKIVTQGGTIVFDRHIVVFQKERTTLRSFLLQRYQKGATPVKLKKRWPNIKFHFYHSTLRAHLGTYADMSSYLLKKGRYTDLIVLPFVLFLAIISFELGGLIYRLKNMWEERIL